MTEKTQVQAATLTIHIEIVNDRADHHVPTDSPLRQPIQLVDPQNSQRQLPTLLDGLTTLDWGGIVYQHKSVALGFLWLSMPRSWRKPEQLSIPAVFTGILPWGSVTTAFPFSNTPPVPISLLS